MLVYVPIRTTAAAVLPSFGDSDSSSAPDFDSLERGRLLETQRSAPARYFGIASGSVRQERTPLPRIAPIHTVDGEQEDAHEAAHNTPQAPEANSPPSWPGPDFKIGRVLPGSVYLWACGERDEGDSPAPVSGPECAAAWVVLMVKIYILSFETPENVGIEQIVLTDSTRLLVSNWHVVFCKDRFVFYD